MNVQDLKEKYKLTPVICQLVQDKIIQIYTFNVRPTDQAIAIILGGQPGAGKGELITIATKMLAGNLVICNADEYRDFHPLSDEIKANYEEFYPDITVDYSQPWNNGLRAFCEQQGLSYVMETTFTSGARMNETISDMKSKGYRVVILLLAVNERFSLLGTYLRYLEMKNLSGYGRRVSKKIHDEKYGLVPSTLKAVQEAGLYDEIQIYKRKPEQRGKLQESLKPLYSPEETQIHERTQIGCMPYQLHHL